MTKSAEWQIKPAEGGRDLIFKFIQALHSSAALNSLLLKSPHDPEVLPTGIA